MNINPVQLHAVNSLKPDAASRAEQVKSAEKLQQAYRDFVGKTFFGQMLKAMRSTIGKPAYFYGGQTEEVFRSQLDQQLADSLSEATAPQIADPMFRHQFPNQAKLLQTQVKDQSTGLENLSELRRR
jgi:Rod binding domain-containing protein